MSRLNNADALEKQLEDLQLVKDYSTSVKKVPPAVPPKKKAQPQVPHSAVVRTLREPSYSSKITPVAQNNNVTNYVNNLKHSQQSHKHYANLGSSQNIYQARIASPEFRTENTPTYSNINFANDKDIVPPPLPPPPSTPYTSKYTVPQEEKEDMLPPPSPVSSNYSELARATANINYHQEQSYPHIYQNEYADYGHSQASTYESLYEPINPRPQSNFSVQVSDSFKNYQGRLSSNKSTPSKEQEVDALTDLLVKSISESQDIDIFGTCVKCNEKVIGETSGCTAMGNMYHVKCFSCERCNINLQGKPFYAVEGQPYCETDYYETLEKCSVCNNPILDRILRATGKPYHPTCFTCVVCGKSLDGIPFTVDAMNQIHCIDDFHKKFAPRCCVCQLPIMPEIGEEETVRVVALDRSFHVRCYRCEDCGLLLSSEAEGRGCYPLDNHILCKNCNGNRVRLLSNTSNVMTTDL